jgi:hypothetical protein
MVNHRKRKKPARVTVEITPVEENQQEALDHDCSKERQNRETPDACSINANNAGGALSQE